MSVTGGLHQKVVLYTATALFNFFAAACLGLSLRYAFVEELNWLRYKHVMHAHSHVAMLGWIYLLLMIFLWRAGGRDVQSQSFSALFWLTELSVLGMLFSFPFEGYGLFSISFSVLFILLSYVFCYKVWKGLAGRPAHSVLLIKTALVWMLLSTLGVWAMGPIMATGGRGSALYYMAIQFFLHFQFNGWFIFGVLALFFHQLERANIRYASKDFRRFYYLLVISCLLTFAQAVTWADPEEFLFVLNSTGVIIQLAALYYFIRLADKPLRSGVRQRVASFPGRFYSLALLSFIAKILIQSVVVIPQVAVISYTIRLYVLGFIHLIMLGAVTSFLLGYGFATGMINYKPSLAKAGWVLLAAGFILSEVILFGQGTLLWAGRGYIPYYYIIIFAASLLLPLGILLAFTGQFTKRSRTIETNLKPF